MNRLALLALGVSLVGFACGLDEGRLDSDDARRLSLELYPATGLEQLTKDAAIGIANGVVGFAVDRGVTVEAFLVDVHRPGNDSVGQSRTVWIVRYSGSIPIAFSPPRNPDGTVPSVPPVAFG